MEWLKDSIDIHTKGKGMVKINAHIEALIKKWKIKEGMCFLNIPHVSASLTMSEGFDPPARADVEQFYDRLVPENQPWFEHTIEGSDDSPSHIRGTLTQSCLTLPIDDGCLTLGIWQGIYLFEHRAMHETQKGIPRKVFVRFLKVS
jgi:secondary thiamine-phosphate synthase enzyme